MTDAILFSPAYRGSLLALQKAQRLIDDTTLRLATGLKVNSALDNPNNFFTARALNNRAGDLARRLDGIGQGIRTIEQGINGVETIENLLQLGESRILEELERFRQFGPLPTPALVTTIAPPATLLDAIITADSPDAYWRLNDTFGTTATNAGGIGNSVDGTYTNGPTLNSTPLYVGGENSVQFNGTDQFVAIPDSNQINTSAQARRSVELVFNADTTVGRQVLYEEGGATNALSIYIDNGRIYVAGRDAGEWGPPNISAPIIPGQTYHVAFTMDSFAGDFIGYLDGVEMGRTTVTATFPSHGSDVAIGRMSDNSWFHDGPQTGDDFYFDGRISDVALYNATLTPADLTARAAAIVPITTTAQPSIQLEEYNDILDQITRVTVDASYRGINLLGNESLATFFNETGSSKLITEGVDFTSGGLGIRRTGFETEDGILDILDSIREALREVRSYGSSLALNMNILATREDFTTNTINRLIDGAQDLTLADVNKEGANLLALQTRQLYATNSLSLANISNASILNLFV